MKITTIDDLRNMRDTKTKPAVDKNATDLAVDAYHASYRALLDEVKETLDAIRRRG